MVWDLEEALDWEPDRDFYGKNNSGDPADAWKPPGYKVVEWEDKQDLEEKEKIEERRKEDKKYLTKMFIICGIPCAISAAYLFYEVISHMVNHGFK